jgi:hypothetical protein
METKTAIQVSVEIRDKLKQYCAKHGYKMSALVEKLILKEIENDG